MAFIRIQIRLVLIIHQISFYKFKCKFLSFSDRKKKQIEKRWIKTKQVSVEK